MNYAETLDYLYTTLPMYQRIGAAAYKEDLNNTLALCLALGNPQQKFRTIHVAGTNGKGSSSHMIASILQAAGYKTGLYTSPHLKDFTERIKINGEPVGEPFVIDFVERITPHLETIKPSFFETTVAMAFDYFAREKVDVAVVEVGLGGRLDSTNVITPMVSLITNIGLDHQNILGDSLEKIAGEKAGIIKMHIPVVISERQPETENVFIQKAQAESASIIFASDVYTIKDKLDPGIFDVLKSHHILYEGLECGLKGYYQRKNLPGVLAVIDQLVKEDWNVPVPAITKGIQDVVVNTGLKGRWQKLSDQPLIICDIGHNEDGIREVLKNIARIPYKHLHIIFGMVNDKDIRGILALLPQQASYYFCQAKIPRAMPAIELEWRAGAVGKPGEVIPDVNDAIRMAISKADPNDLIFVGGSTFVVAEIDNL